MRLSKGIELFVHVGMTGEKEGGRNVKVARRNVGQVDDNQIGGRAAMSLTASKGYLYTA